MAYGFNGANADANEVMIGGVRYVPAEQGGTDVAEVIRKIVPQVIKETLAAMGNYALPTQGVQNPSDNYTVKSVEKLEDEKVSNEILATLFDSMPKPHPSRLRPFFTELEQEVGIPLSKFHKERTQGLVNRGEGKYPYRKMDSVLMKVEPSVVFEKAKKYNFTK